MNNNAISYSRRSLSRSLKFVFPLFCILACYSSFAQHPVGIFDDNVDIGNPKLAGSASYDEANQTYNISGAGSNIWFTPVSTSPRGSLT